MTYDTAVLTVVYPKSLCYFKEFLSSLELQDDQNFVLYIFADCVEVEQTTQNSPIDIKIVNAIGSPAQIRCIAIQTIINSGFKKIIFADSDDKFSSNRIKDLKLELRYHDILFHNLYTFSSEVPCSEALWGSRFIDKQKIAFEEILSGNCLGLSNTAINTKCINLELLNLLSKYSDLIAFDWAFYALILHEGFHAYFVQNTFTEYRQHDNNTATISLWNEASIRNSITVKVQQYSLLASVDNQFTKLQNDFTHLKKRYDRDNIFKHKYCEFIKTLQLKDPLWWEAIQLWNI